MDELTHSFDQLPDSAKAALTISMILISGAGLFSCVPGIGLTVRKALYWTYVMGLVISQIAGALLLVQHDAWSQIKVSDYLLSIIYFTVITYMYRRQVRKWNDRQELAEYRRQQTPYSRQSYHQ